MFITWLVILAAVSCTANGSIFEVRSEHPNAKYFHNSRIVGGVTAPKGYGRHMAALLYGYRWVSFICGGSIVTKRHILTAAHCIDVMLTWNQQLVESFRAVIGTDKWATGTNEVEFISYKIHPGWNWDTIKNDIGVLKVDRDIHPSETVAIIPLSFRRVEGGFRSYVTGFGLHADMNELPEILQLLDVRTLKHDDCQERMLKAAESVGTLPKISSELEICALHSVGHGMCNGDSGSALILRDSWVQIGIVSWGIACATGAPDVYARVSGFEAWTRANTDGLLPY